MKHTGQRERGTTEEYVARRNREGDSTSRMELERSANECPKPCPVEKSLVAYVPTWSERLMRSTHLPTNADFSWPSA